MKIPVSLVILLLWFVCAVPSFGADGAAAGNGGAVTDAALILGLSHPDAGQREQTLMDMALSGNSAFDPVLEAYRTGSLYLYDGHVVLRLEKVFDANAREVLVIGDPFTEKPLLSADGNRLLVSPAAATALSPDRAERKLASRCRMILALSSKDVERRLAAARRVAFDREGQDLLPHLDKLTQHDPVASVRRSAKESAAIIRFKNAASPQERMQAAAVLGDLGSLAARSLIVSQLRDGGPDNAEAGALQQALDRIDRHSKMVQVFEIVKSGLSSGSILALMALGLAVTFGMMGVINMAHGEMMMIGAYGAYAMQLLFGHTPDHPVDSYFLVALLFSFLVAALAGGLIEWLVVRKLYKRPLESLLATYGIGLILIQCVRLVFGDNCPSNSPVWLRGGFEIAPDMLIPINRLFILLLCFCCVGVVYLLMNRTTLGLKMRGVMQNRDMAAAMGVNTRLVDCSVFMLGSGLAGIAGCALTAIGGITPDMGQNYIVDSFLVVVTGGVGALAGVVCNGFGLGIINKLLEGTFFGAVWAKIIVLAAVIAFIQYRPAGLFAPKGRLADDN